MLKFHTLTIAEGASLIDEPFSMLELFSWDLY